MIQTPVNVVQEGTGLLSDVDGIKNPEQEAAFLFRELFGEEYCFFEGEILKSRYSKYIEYINKRRALYPIQYITGKAYFDDIIYEVSEGVFIPRQDTELLIEEAVRVYKGGNILDICTGCGNIAISLAKRFKESRIFATDISQKAISCAKKNAHRILPCYDIGWMCTNLWNGISNTKFSLIVSNPPYLSSKDLLNIPDNVKKEPITALYGGKNGCVIIKRIIKKAWQMLEDGGYILIEIGDNHKIDVLSMAEGTKRYKRFYTIKNLFGIDRILCLRG